MDASSSNARASRNHEALIFGAFVLICMAGVWTVLMPETENDRDAQAAGTDVSHTDPASPTPK